MEELVGLTLKLHGSARARRDFTLRSMQEHVVEVRMLLKQGDDHWKAETVDILIHCLLLLQAEGIRDSEIAALIERRLGRFKEKISTAMREMKR